MGLFSWCTSDTRKSISVGMDGYTGAPKEVYLLNPFGEPYKETDYHGYGVFGGRDVHALVAIWNCPEQCKDEHGNWLPDDEIRGIGIKLACYDNDHVQLKYPIKIVEKPLPYEEAKISPGCPFQGYFYDESLQGILRSCEKVFEDLEEAKENYECLKDCIGNGTEKYFEVLKVRPLSSFAEMVAKHQDTPENVLMELAKNDSIYVQYEVVNNQKCPKTVLSELLKVDDEYLQNKVRKHPNFREISLNGRIQDAKQQTKNSETRHREIEQEL